MIWGMISVLSIVPMCELSSVAANFSTMSDMGKVPQTSSYDRVRVNMNINFT